MKSRFFSYLALGLVLSLQMSCTSARVRRIENNPEIFSKLNSSDQILVQEGKIREGMTKEGVFLAYGRPDAVAKGTVKGAKLEKWTYMGSRPVYTNNMSFGMGYGRWGGWGGGWGAYGWGGTGCGYYGAWDPYWGGMATTVTYIPYQAASVTFKNDRVAEHLTGAQ